MIVYIATIFAVLECLTGRAVADEKSMDGVCVESWVRAMVVVGALSRVLADAGA
jgi:hypothetical protein